eukprot:16442162-Heterocapsa_arctica.AAC.1
MSMAPLLLERPGVDASPGDVLAPSQNGRKANTAAAAASSPRGSVEVVPCCTRGRSQQGRARCLSFRVQGGQVQDIFVLDDAAQPWQGVRDCYLLRCPAVALDGGVGTAGRSPGTQERSRVDRMLCHECSTAVVAQATISLAEGELPSVKQATMSFTESELPVVAGRTQEHSRVDHMLCPDCMAAVVGQATTSLAEGELPAAALVRDNGRDVAECLHDGEV